MFQFVAGALQSWQQRGQQIVRIVNEYRCRQSISTPVVLQINSSNAKSDKTTITFTQQHPTTYHQGFSGFFQVEKGKKRNFSGG